MNANDKPSTELIDDENPEWSDDRIKQAVDFEALPTSLRAKLREPPKELVTIRLSPQVLQSFRAAGNDWQSRIDAALIEWLKSHSTAV